MRRAKRIDLTREHARGMDTMLFTIKECTLQTLYNTVEIWIIYSDYCSISMWPFNWWLDVPSRAFTWTQVASLGLTPYSKSNTVSNMKGFNEKEAVHEIEETEKTKGNSQKRGRLTGRSQGTDWNISNIIRTATEGQCNQEPKGDGLLRDGVHGDGVNGVRDEVAFPFIHSGRWISV